MNELPYTCRYCGHLFCSNHRIPEDHSCKPIENIRNHNEDKWKETVKDIYSPTYNKQKNSKINNKSRARNYSEELSDWLGECEYHSYDYTYRLKYLFPTILKLVFSLIVLSIIYSNIQNLNEITILIIKIGSVLLLAALFFIIKYGYKLLEEIPNWFKRQERWLRYLLIVILLFLLWYGYQNKETVLNHLLDTYNEIDFSILNPFNLSNIGLIEDLGLNKEPKQYEIAAFSTLNELRKERSYNLLAFDQGLYEYALELSRNTYNKVEFNPAYDFKIVKLFHYGDENPIESEYKSLPYLLNTKIIEIKDYSKHQYGAVACYKNICSYIGSKTKGSYISNYKGSDKFNSFSQPNINVYDLEKSIHNLINQERENQ
jgi:hypothetical protein